jgi:hypothetical protein
VTYLVVGLDRHTLAPWHRNVRARDPQSAASDAVDRARGAGVDLVVAAVIGSNSCVVFVPMDDHATSARAA